MSTSWGDKALHESMNVACGLMVIFLPFVVPECLDDGVVQLGGGAVACVDGFSH